MFLIDVVEVNPLEGRKLALKFADGLEGVIAMDQLIRHYTGIFLPLLDESFFRRVRVDPELGTIVWPNGADVCPDVLYATLSGKPVIVVGRKVLG
jgi:hypothetical protein